MNFKHRSGMKKYSTGVGTGIGIIISVISCIILAALLTTVTLNETIREEGVAYTVPVILLLSSLLGSFAAGKIVEEKKFLACLLTMGAYIFLLIGMTILFFDGVFQNMLLNLAMIFIGGGSSILLNTKKNKRTVRKMNSRRSW